MRALEFAPPAELGLCPDRLQRLLDVLKADVDRGRLPGAVALVARRGRIALFDSLGRQDPAAGTPMARDSIFRIYSMTKPVVSVAVMMLVEQGRLLLTDPVARHLPEFANQKVAVERDGRVVLEAVARPATVQDLLRHTAGLTYEFMGEAAVQRQYAALQMGSRERSNAEFSRALAALPLMHQPGSVWDYSRATDVLGRLIEVLSGQSLGDYLREAIFVPLGMPDTGFAVDAADQHRIAEPFAHDPDGGVPLRVLDPRRRTAMESGGGGLLSTAMDYARFLQFMRNRGELQGVRLLGSRSVDFMTSDHLGTIPVAGEVLPPGYGFGLGFAVRTAAGISAMPGSAGLYYWGGIAGTTFFVDPAEDLYALLMIQAPNQRDFYRPLFRGLVYAALLDEETDMNHDHGHSHLHEHSHAAAATDWKHDGVRVISGGQLDGNVPSTPGMDRKAAINFARVGAQKLWAGTVTIHANAKTGAHHHGHLESVIYVVRGRARMRWGEKLEFTAEAGPGDFIYVPPYVPHQEINASPTESLECVLCRSDGEAVAINLDIAPAEQPEQVLWIDPTHPQGGV